jgi:hypothetical protein
MVGTSIDFEQIGNEYQNPAGVKEIISPDMSMLDIYNDDLIKALPDRTFYENEQWKEDDAIEFASA